ncbi:hypothetical protein CPB85DRAFT_1330844 [Mucidula mucida]|nr:hypothetical protein CPB85DRAFT_1330844 [Mucidula mucida]
MPWWPSCACCCCCWFCDCWAICCCWSMDGLKLGIIGYWGCRSAMIPRSGHCQLEGNRGKAPKPPRGRAQRRRQWQWRERRWGGQCSSRR